MKNKKIIPNQINFNNNIEVESSSKFVSVAIYDVIIKPINEIENQFSFIKKNNDYNFLNNLNLNKITSQNETIDPELTILNFNSDKQYYFYSYANKKNFDDTLTKMYDKNKNEEINTEDKILRHYTFFIFDLAHKKICIIKNPNAKTWEKVLKEIFKQNGFFLDVIPLKNKDIEKLLKENKVTYISYKTSNKKEILTYSDCYNDDEYLIDELKVKVKLKEASFISKEKYIKSRFLNQKDNFTELKIELEDKILDVLNENLTKQTRIELPKSLEPNTQNMIDLEKTLFNILITGI